MRYSAFVIGMACLLAGCCCSSMGVDNPLDLGADGSAAVKSGQVGPSFPNVITQPYLEVTLNKSSLLSQGRHSFS